MIIPTGDYIIEFIDHRGVEMGQPFNVMAATLTEAQTKAKGYLSILKAANYRILRVVEQSTDKDRY